MIKKKIGEVEYEFDTVQELLEFESLVSDKSTTSEPKKGIVFIPNPKRRKYTTMSKSEYKKKMHDIWNLRNSNMSFIDVYNKVFENRRVIGGHDYRMMRKLFGAECLSHYKKSHKVTKDKDKPIDKRIQRAKDISTIAWGLIKSDSTLDKKEAWKEATERRRFIESRTKNLMHMNNKLTYEQARDRAKLESMLHNKTGIIRESKFPQIETISNEHQGILENVIKNIIGTRGRLTYFEVINTINVNPAINNGIWHGYIWHKFVTEVLEKSKQISAYFNVPNKFKCVMNGNHQVLNYGDEYVSA